VLVVCDAMLDRYWFGDVERISPRRRLPVVHVRSTEERLGGAQRGTQHRLGGRGRRGC